MTDPAPVLQQWQRGQLGRALISAEAQLLATTFDDVFGLELLQLGTWGAERELLAPSRIRRQSVIADSVGREARRQILGEVVRAWVDEIPESELESHYAKALADLDEHDLSLLAAWHASLEVGHPLPNREFLVNVFPSLGDHRREALKIAAGFRGEEAFEAGVGEEQAFDTVLPWLSDERCRSLAAECLELYCWDRLGAEN